MLKVIEKALITDVLDINDQPIYLNSLEAHRALQTQRHFDSEYKNALGFDLPITTLTAISKSIVEQKFFTIAPADYMPVRVGENAWSDQILTYLSYDIAADFETGNINTGSNNARLAEADAGVTGVYNPVIDWAKQITWSYVDLRKAARAGNWDLIAEKERARKTNWDLGIQKIAFLGSANNPSVMGLLNQSGVNSNTSLIQEYISSMTANQFSSFVQGVVGAYRTNANYTAMPNRFTIPELDYDGLANLIPGTVGTYPVPMIEYLQKVFVTITGREDFKIQRCAYADQTRNAAAGINKNRYALYNYNEDSLRMDIPVDYTNTLQNTVNGFQFQNVGYGEYTGVLAYRPLEMLYFDWNV